MKQLTTLLCLFLLMASAMAQTPTQTTLAFDSTFVKKTTGAGNAELILMNGSRSRTGAFLQNRYGGRTQYAYAVDTAYKDGLGNLILHRGDGDLNLGSMGGTALTSGNAITVGLDNTINLEGTGLTKNAIVGLGDNGDLVLDYDGTWTGNNYVDFYNYTGGLAGIYASFNDGSGNNLLDISSNGNNSITASNSMLVGALNQVSLDAPLIGIPQYSSGLSTPGGVTTQSLLIGNDGNVYTGNPSVTLSNGNYTTASGASINLGGSPTATLTTLDLGDNSHELRYKTDGTGATYGTSVVLPNQVRYYDATGSGGGITVGQYSATANDINVLSGTSGKIFTNYNSIGSMTVTPFLPNYGAINYSTSILPGMHATYVRTSGIDSLMTNENLTYYSGLGYMLDFVGSVQKGNIGFGFKPAVTGNLYSLAIDGYTGNVYMGSSIKHVYIGNTPTTTGKATTANSWPDASGALLHLYSGTTTVAPLRIIPGTNVTTPVSGNIESDGTHIYWTNSSGTRIQLDN